MNFKNMTKKENSIIINSEKIEIIEEKRPIRTMFFLALGISIPSGISNTIQYLDSGETRYLFIASFMISLFVLAIIVEVFFVTYQKEIDIQKITKLRIKPILFSNGQVVYLDVKIGRKTRPIKLRKEKAKEIKQELSNIIA